MRRRVAAYAAKGVPHAGRTTVVRFGASETFRAMHRLVNIPGLNRMAQHGFANRGDTC